MSQVQIRDSFDRPIPLINYTVSTSENPDDPYLEDFFVDAAANSSWPRTGIPHNNVYFHVNYYSRNARFEYQKIKVDTTNDIKISLRYAPLTKIQVYKFQFNIGHLKGNSDFRLYQRILDGEDVSGLLLQRNTVGSRSVRTFGMTSAASFGHDFKPQDYPNYYSGIVNAANLLNYYGLYWYFTVFADTQLVMPLLRNQQDHFNKVVAELEKCPNVYLELVNEQGQHANSVDRNQFTKPVNIVSSSGSFGGRIPPDPPHWDFIDYHNRRDYPGCVTEVNTADYRDNQNKSRYDLGIPIGTGEGVKLGTGGDFNDIRVAFEVGMSGFGVSPHNYFHSKQGGQSELFDNDTEACAKAFFGA